VRLVDRAACETVLWDVTIPSRAGRLPGVSMAGFRQRAPIVDIPVVPYPAVTVAFDLGAAPYVLADGRGGEHRGGAVAGIGPRGIRTRGRNIEALQVRLSPVVAYGLLGASAAELGDAVVGLDDIWGREATRTEERLREAESWDERFAIVETTLLRPSGRVAEIDPEVAFAWSRLTTRYHQARVEELADAVGWSRKRLWARFRSQIGLTPKHAARLIRFDQATHRLAAGQPAAAVAADAGYADQSHLNREVVAFAGMTPTNIADAAWLSVDGIAWPREHSSKT
jgi:AraC-like DNA-binding protein